MLIKGPRGNRKATVGVAFVAMLTCRMALQHGEYHADRLT